MKWRRLTRKPSLWKGIESFHRSNKFHFADFWSNQCYKLSKKQFRKKLVDARNDFIDMHLIQSLKNKFWFDLPLFSKYPATSKNSYFYKMTLFGNNTWLVLMILTIHNVMLTTNKKMTTCLPGFLRTCPEVYTNL